MPLSRVWDAALKAATGMTAPAVTLVDDACDVDPFGSPAGVLPLAKRRRVRTKVVKDRGRYF